MHMWKSVGFFTSESTLRPAWWPQTLSEVKWNSQSSHLWKISIVKTKCFHVGDSIEKCPLSTKKKTDLNPINKVGYTAWQNALQGRLKSTGSSRQVPSLQNKSKHDFSSKKIWLLRPTQPQVKGKQAGDGSKRSFSNTSEHALCWSLFFFPFQSCNGTAQRIQMPDMHVLYNVSKDQPNKKIYYYYYYHILASVLKFLRQ